MKLVFIYFYIFFVIELSFAVDNIFDLRTNYLAKKLVSISSFSETEFEEKDNIIKNLTLFEYYIDKNDLEHAKVYYELLKSCYPVNQLVNYRLGKYYFKEQDYVRAKECFEQCVKNDSQFHEARRYLLQICFKNKDYEQALKHSRILTYFKPDKETLRIYDYLIYCFRDKGYNISKLQFSNIKKFEETNNSPLIDVGISTKDNGKLMKIDCIKFFVSNNFEVYDDKNKKILFCEGGEKNLWTIVYRTKLGKLCIISPYLNKETRISAKYLIIKPLKEKDTIFVSEYKWFKNNFPQNKEYRGELVVKHLKDQIVVINRVKLDEYLYSVVAEEIGKDKPSEALKTQAVVARSVALYRKKTKIHRYFDICRGQHCQVYSGVRKESKETIDAVNSTIGEVVVNNSSLVGLFFHANCGGLTKRWWLKNDLISDVVEQKDYEIKNIYYWYLLPPNLYCGPSEYVHTGLSRWVRVVEKKSLENYLNEKYNIGKLKNIKIISHDVNLYIKKMEIVGSKKTVVLSKEHLIRNIVPLGPLRSASFIIEYNKNTDEFYFFGAGWGHGVGMCQSGVSNLAKQGENYVNIIKHYYPDVEIKKLY
jgi:stage II sporulation protein D